MKDVEKKKRKLVVYPEKCKGCTLCVGVCPTHVLEMGGNLNQRGFQYVGLIDVEKCTCCGVCVIMCPDVALEVVENKEDAEK